MHIREVIELRATGAQSLLGPERQCRAHGRPEGMGYSSRTPIICWLREGPGFIVHLAFLAMDKVGSDSQKEPSGREVQVLAGRSQTSVKVRMWATH